MCHKALKCQHCPLAWCIFETSTHFKISHKKGKVVQIKSFESINWLPDWLWRGVMVKDPTLALSLNCCLNNYWLNLALKRPTAMDNFKNVNTNTSWHQYKQDHYFIFLFQTRSPRWVTLPALSVSFLWSPSLSPSLTLPGSPSPSIWVPPPGRSAWKPKDMLVVVLDCWYRIL